jgi:glycosyltransferase involved in cell wall biosynthesis/2-polyprenyl-3-methyl-5-hydroxy-6-metoxy-1,4-benzoquinol methylase
MQKRNYIKNEARVHCPDHDTDFVYTDGIEVEDQIYKTIKETSDVSLYSEDLRKSIWDWASEYHFSSTRANLLGAFDFTGYPKLLEIGSGCGAITRQLGEKGCKVTALEGSYTRAKITAERCRDLENVEVYCDSFQDFSFDSLFDCITLIGVLEYSPRFLNGDDPVQEMLSRAYKLLEEKGVLVIAIENQLGLKYFNGCREDHKGELFAGLNDLYDDNNSVTFGRKEIESEILKAGFTDVEFVYPFPDYKLPQLLIREEAFKHDSLRLGSIIGQFPARDYLDFAEKTLVENLTWPVIDRNKLIRDFSNSFLIFAFKGNGSLDDLADPWLMKSYCGHRKKQYLTSNTFNEEGLEIVVNKTYLFPDMISPNSTPSNSPLRHQLERSTYIAGNPYNYKWLKRLFRENPYQGYLEYLTPWTDYLRSHLAEFQQQGTDEPKTLPGDFFDCVPANLIESPSGEIRYFDREWVYEGPLRFEFLVFRGVMHDIMRYSYWYQKTDLFLNLTLDEWFEKLFFDLQIDVTNDLVHSEFLKLELESQATINGIFNLYDSSIDLSLQYSLMQEEFKEKRQSFPPTKSLLNTQAYLQKEDEKLHLARHRDDLLAHQDKLVKHLNELIKHQDELVKQLDEARTERNTIEREYYQLENKWEVINREILDIKNGPSWKIGRKITYLPRKLKQVIQSLREGIFWAKVRQKLNLGWILHLPESYHLVFEKGPKGVKQRMAELASERNYQRWFSSYFKLTESDKQGIENHIDSLNTKPLISIVMPTYNTSEKWLRLAIDSVLVQLYTNWELCIVDDASTDTRVKEVIKEYARKDTRIKPTFRSENGHISAASNTGLEQATGEFIALLDHDDELTDDALYYVVNEINNFPDAHLFYSDEDKIDANGCISIPYFKTDWNPDLFNSHNFVCHLGVYRRSILNQIKGFRVGFEGAQDWDLCARFVEQISPEQIRHIPKVLYHWRMIPGSTGMDINYKEYAINAAKRTIEESLVRKNKKGEVVYHKYNDQFSAFRVKYTLSKEPHVSLIVLTRDGLDVLKKCIDSILQKTGYQNYEILIVDNGSQEAETLEYFEDIAKHPKVSIVKDDRDFNFSALNNNAVRKTAGEIIGLINNDIEVIAGDWLQEMVSFAVQPETGAVGARLLYPDNTVQHAGVIVGLGGVAGHAHKHFPDFHPGYDGRAVLIQNFSAVTAACLVMRRSIFDEIGGLDEENLAVAFNDVDFCLKIRDAGYNIVYNPFAELYHHESKSRGYENTLPKIIRFEKEKITICQRWGEKLAVDPFYNPNLTLDREDFSLAEQSRCPKPWLNDS